jgi:hypothetical protein
MPVCNYVQVVKFSAMCGATVPAWLGHIFISPVANSSASADGISGGTSRGRSVVTAASTGNQVRTDHATVVIH